jgi:non-ribosomal peptide synthetase component F
MESAGTVCKGCFFTSSSLAAEYAKKHNISVVIGATLSRGQIIENKLYNLLKQGVTDAEEIEKKLSDIQRLTGEMNENIFEYIDIDAVKDGTIYDKVKTVDFYRYCDVTNAEMLSYLNSRDSYWEKRKNYAVYSTNCPIKQIGDYEHLHKKGYHYYGSATSWEKRLGHIALKDIEQDLQCNVKEQAVNNFKRRLDLERSKASGRLESKFICAYYTSDTEQTVSELREYLIKEIPEYMVPSYFIRLEKIPLTPEGKVNKNLLPEPEGSINTGVKYAAPESAIEEKLTQIWEEILGIERVGCNDNFFELGGHSLKATILVSRVHKEFNVELPLREIFKTPTIKELSKCIISGKQNLFEPIRELEKKEYYQLSSAQMRLFIINKYEDVGLSYNMSEVKLIEGCLDPDKLEKSLKELINRHEALRTSFQIIDGEPMQKINSEVAFNISHIDIGQSTVEDVDNKLEKIIKVFVRPFDLSEAPLIRVGLVKLSEEKHIFIIDMHHIISDGTSVGILTRDIEALLNGRSLPPMKVQYKDYAAWQKELLKKDFIKRQEEYWIEILSGELPVLNLPADFERPSIRSFDGDRIEFVISEEMTVGLKKLASETNATLYMILMSVYNILLSKYANQEDIIIGTPVAGRQHADVENMMGMFVNTLVMRNYPQGNKTFKEFLEEVKNYALKAFENQDYPLDELIHKLKLRKDPSRNPLFDTIFVLQNTAIKEIETENLKFSRYATKNRVSKFDVSLEITEQENKLNCVLEYCTKLFSKDSMELMSRDYEEILNKILEDRTIKLSEIELSKRYQMRESVLTDDIEFNF